MQDNFNVKNVASAPARTIGHRCVPAPIGARPKAVAWVTFVMGEDDICHAKVAALRTRAVALNRALLDFFTIFTKKAGFSGRLIAFFMGGSRLAQFKSHEKFYFFL
ncbi:MAG: hypothetical protein IT260_17815 [Saprospiraceae bacterium]|nr:hypothetical protein [Saprospiraceae bacterium]